MDDCVVSEAQNACVQVAHGGRVSALDSLCSKSQTAHGMCCAHGATLSVVDCRFERNEGAGMLATDGATAELLSCNSKGNKEGGFFAQGRVSMKLIKCSSEGGEHGCGVTAGATLEAENCTITDSESGYNIESKADVHLTDCNVASCSHCGLMIGGAGTKLLMEEGALSDNGLHAVHVLHGAEARVKGVKSSGHMIAGFICTHKGSKLELQQCESTDRNPYACTNSGVMERVNCRPSGSSASLENALRSHMMETMFSEMQDD